jgi:plasmid stabilization system protein ParE
MLEVVLSETAKNELESAYEWWATNRSRDKADQWYNGFLMEMLRLERSPERYAVASENDEFPLEIRQLNYGVGRKSTHRAVFTIQANRVIILRVRHLAQKLLDPADD